MSLQDKYSSVVSAAQTAGISDLKRFKNKTEFFTFQELLLLTLQKDAVWNALGAIDATYSASDINIDVQVAGLAAGTSLTVDTESSNLNIRQEPSTEGVILGKAAKKAEVVTLVEQSSDEWWKIKTKDGERRLLFQIFKSLIQSLKIYLQSRNFFGIFIL